jgi:hypothetical protein
MNNYGLSGQPDEAYDNFLCFSKKCKRRKAERHKIRMDKRKLKNDQRKAETESMRAETSVMKNIAAPQTAAPQIMRSQAPTMIQQPSAVAPAQVKPQQAGFAGNSMMMIVGVLLVGGFIYNSMKNKQQAGAGVPAAA